MADPVWGQLAKAQDDPQTIEDAITAAISAHNDDPTAHTSTGQSLALHRENGILDHPAGSSLADKLTMSEFTFGDNFSNLSLYTITGSVDNSDWPSAFLYVEYGATATSSLYSPLLFPGPYLDNDFDFLFQISAQWQSSSVSNLDISLGLGVDSLDAYSGIGFVIHNGVVKGILAVEGTSVLTSDLGIDIRDPHVYRAQFIAGEDIGYFFIDGIQKATLARPTGDFNDDGNLMVQVHVTGSNDGNFRVDHLFISRAALTS